MREEAPIDLHIPGLEHSLAMFVHGQQDKFVSRQIREQGIWEPYETSLVLQLLHPGSVFVDVGANLGYFSVVAASLVGDAGKVVAFEPDPANFELLRASSDLNHFGSRIQAVQAGLSDRASDGRLYLSQDNMGDHQIYAGEGDRESLPIELLNGTDFLIPLTPQIDLLKVDTQGSEYQVMTGLMPLLKEQAIAPRIIIELTPFSLRESGASGRMLIELLASLDLPLWIIDHVEHELVESTAHELAKWCDDVDASTGDQGFMNILVGEM
ncbi:MAG: FkbM family methyltransferase [Halioglobus sp.]